MPPRQRERNPETVRGTKSAAAIKARAAGAAAAQRQHDIQKYGAFEADRRRRVAKRRMFSEATAYASVGNKGRTSEGLASMPDPHRYYTKKQIQKDPRLSQLVADRRAAIAELRGRKFDRSNVQRTQIGFNALHIPYGNKLGQTVGLIGQDFAYAPAGIYHTATTDPRKTIPEIVKASAYPFLNPVDAFNKHPDQLFFAAMMGANTAIAAPAKAAAIRAAIAEGAGVKGVTSAALRHTGGGTRTIFDPANPEASTTANYAGSAMGPLLGRVSDRLFNNRAPGARVRRGKLVKPAEYGKETQMLPNPEYQAAVDARRAAHQELQAARQQVRQGNRYGSTARVTATPRTPEAIDARIAQLDRKIDPVLERHRAGYAAEAKAAGGKHVHQGQSSSFTPASDWGALEWKNEWAKAQNAKLVPVPGDGRRLTWKDAPEPWNETSKHLKGGGDTRAAADARLMDGLRQAAKGTGKSAKMARDFLAAVAERDSLAALRSKHAAAALFPEEAPVGGLGVDMKANRGAGRTQAARDEAAARLSAAEAAARDAEAAAAGVPSHVPVVRNRLVSPEVRAPTTMDRVSELSNAGGVRDWLGHRKFESEKMQQERVGLEQKYASMTDDEVRSELQRSLGTKHPFLRVLRFGNRVQRVALLYLKLGYIPSNLISQEVMSAIHQGVFMPLNRGAGAMFRDTATGKVIRAGLRSTGLGRYAVEPGTAQQIRTAMHVSGVGRTISGSGGVDPAAGLGARLGKAVESGAERADMRIGAWFGKIVDDPYRLAALIHEMRRKGINARELGRFLDEVAAHRKKGGDPALDPRGTGAAMEAKLTEASRRGGRAVVDYGRMGKTAQALRDFAFILPWVKGAFHYTAQFPVEHPYQSYGVSTMAQVGKEHTGLDKHLPSFLQGSFKVGERNTPIGKVPLIVNPRYVNTLTQPYDTGAALLTTASDIPHWPKSWTVHGSKYRSIADVLQPLYGDALGQYSKTGTFGLGHLGSQFITSTPLYALVHGVRHPANARSLYKLHPRTATDAWIQWLIGSVSPKPMNPVSAKNISRQEDRAGLSGAAAVELNSKFFTQDVMEKVETIAGRKLTPAERRGLTEMAADTKRHALARVYVIKNFPQFIQMGKKTALDTRGELLAAVAAGQMTSPKGVENIKAFSAFLSTQKPDWNKGHKHGHTEKPSEKTLRHMIERYNEITANRPYTEGGAPVPVN